MPKKLLSFISTFFGGINILTRIVLAATSIVVIVMVSYLMGGFAYLTGSWGTDTQSYIAMLVWIDKYFPSVPFWYPLSGGGVSLTHAYPPLSFFIVSFIKRIFDINLFASLSVVGYGSIVIIAVSIYTFVSLRFKNQTAALIASVCYLIAPVSWTWLTNWGFYAESISHVFIVPAILFWDLFFTSILKKDYGVKMRTYLFFTVLFTTLTSATHFLSGYAVMGIYYAYTLIYFLLSHKERKHTLLHGVFALIVVGLLSLAATAAFSTPFARYAKFASVGGNGVGSQPTMEDYQRVLPTIKNVVGLEEIKRGDFTFGLKYFKYPVIVSFLALLGIVFYNWKDKRKWVYAVYGLWGIFLAFTPAYYVYFLNVFPIGFVASSFGWRPMYALMRMVVPILAGLGIVGLASLPFIFFKHKIFKYPVNITVAIISLIAFGYAINWQVNNSKGRNLIDMGALGIDTKNVWQERDAEGYLKAVDHCPLADDLKTQADKEGFDAKFVEIGGFERWCNSTLTNYFPPLTIGDWCSFETKKGNTNLPPICNPENLNDALVKDLWQKCKLDFDSMPYCHAAYQTLEEQLKLSSWPKPKLTTGYDPNRGLDQVLEKIESDNPNARIDFSPYMGGDSMMSPFYNVNRNLSQIHIYVASASLILRFQGFQQAVYYLNSPMFDSPEMLNDINKWFGINYVFDVPNVYDTPEESLFKRAGWEVFSGDWGHGIYKYPQKNELAELSAKKSVLVIGQKAYSTYDQVFTMSLLGTLPYDQNILIWGKDMVDDYSLEELKKFDTLILQGYTYKNKRKADSLLTKYVEDGGGVFIDTGWQYKNPDWESKSTLNIIPLKSLSWNDLGKASDYSKGDGGAINSDLDINGFGSLEYDGGSWGVSTSNKEELKPWAKVEISVADKPIIVSGTLGRGKIVWSGMNIFAHAKQKEKLYTDEVKILKNAFNWLSAPKEPKNYEVSYKRVNPDKVVFSLPSTDAPSYLLWKEGFYPDFRASLIQDGQKMKLNVMRAGPGWVLIETPKLNGASEIVYEYKKPLAEILANVLSISTFILLLILIIDGFRGSNSILTRLLNRLFSIKLGSKILQKTNWISTKGDEDNEY